ncbi:hypothetical protein Tco_0721721, partial [Tanacetum coccineum]
MLSLLVIDTLLTNEATTDWVVHDKEFEQRSHPTFDEPERSEEEVTETMTEPTMEEYMTKTREGYGSGIARPKIKEKDHFELKGQFLKELRDNTFSRSDNENANEHIEKVLEIVELFHIPNITQDQNAIMEAGGKDHPPMLASGIDNDIYSIVDACLNACEMWKAIERLKQGESINVQDLETNLYWEFGKFTSQDGETLESYYSRMAK